MLNHKLLHVQLSFQSTLTHKWGLEQNQFISNSCIFSWLCTAVAFQRGSRFCPLAHVRTFLPALSFKLYYVDLDFIERGSLSEARSDVRRGMASRSEDFQLCLQKVCNYMHKRETLSSAPPHLKLTLWNVPHPPDFSGVCLFQCSRP